MRFLNRLRNKIPCRTIIRKSWRYLRYDCHAVPDKGIKNCQQSIRDKVGLEIGGPSPIFAKNGLFPIYPFVKRLDNCNFSQQTVWEGSLSEGMHFHYDGDHPPSRQFIRDAVDLHGISADAYDFVLSSHNIEHIANPLRAFREWLRVLKDSGIIVLAVPHLDGTFDHNRPVTPLRHIVEDFQNNVGEDDLTHLPEILALHDLQLDPLAGSIENFRKRSEQNQENRCLHQHVFDTALVLAVMDYMGLQIRHVRHESPFHIIAVGEKPPAGQKRDNSLFLNPHADYRLRSPFPSDRLIGNGVPQLCGN